MPSRKSKNIWISDSSGRSIFGWKIKEEIFAIFFILILLALANDDKIVEKTENIYIQVFIGLIVIYCIYNRIPWSLAFILLFVIASIFSNFFENIKGTVLRVIKDVKEKVDSDDKKIDSPFAHIGAKVLGWLSKEKKKGILKKVVKFEDTESETCKEVSQMFGLNDDPDPETEPETDGEEQESLKESLKFFMKEIKN